MRTSLKDIAEYTGLSKSTISMYLNNHALAKWISIHTKARIDEAVKKFNYVPSYTARALSSGKTQTIGLVVGDLALPHPSQIASKVMGEANRNGLQLLISATKFSPEREVKCLENLLNRHVDGIIYPLWSPSADAKLYNRLIEEHYPLVMIFNRDEYFHSIINDFSNAMRQAVDFFARNGAKKITIIADSSTISNVSGENMHDTFIKACVESGCIPDTESLSVFDIASIDANLERISRNPPDFLIIQGSRLMSVLTHKLNRYQHKYPCIVNIIADWDQPPLRDNMLVGIIMYYTEKIIITAVDTLLQLINKPMNDSIPLLSMEPAEFLLSWPGDSSENTFDEVKRLIGYNGIHNWNQIY